MTLTHMILKCVCVCFMQGARLYSNLTSGFKGRSQNLKAKFSGFWNTQRKAQAQGAKAR